VLFVVNLIVKAGYDEVSVGAARIVAETVQAIPNARLCLPTGRTPRGMYRELIRLHRTERLDFSRVRVFQLDEYIGLRPGHPETFKSYLWREFLNHVNVRRANIHFIENDYEEVIRSNGGIDLLVLGIGINGHLGFNEPGSETDSRTRIVDLAGSTINGMRHTFAPDELPHQAVTIGIATIMEARRILLLASGTEKASILAKALGDPVTTALPASILQLHANVTVIADQDALSL
jgi:glucosamine-6-phosphate deaminase